MARLTVKFPSRASALDIVSVLVASMVAFLLWSGSPLLAQDDCKVVEKVGAEALKNVHTTPTHVYTTTKVNGQSFSSEIIYAGGSMYAKVNGKWTSAGSIQDVEESEQQMQHNANSKDTCRQLKDESISGEAATVYTSHSETSKGIIDMQFWISKTNGRMLRQDMTGNSVVMSSRYEYSGVKPPL